MPKGAWWGSRDNVSPRMVLEITAMKQLFDKNRLVPIPATYSWDDTFTINTHDLKLDTGQYNLGTGQYYPVWHITFDMRPAVDSNSQINPRGKHVLRIVYPSQYPENAANAYVDEPTLEATLHRFVTGELCLYNHSDSRASHGWDPARSTAATIALWSIQWLRTYYYFQRTGDWPSVT